MNDKTGGSAFPIGSGDMRDPGMTLRDYFAAKALLGLIAEPPWSVGASGVASRLSDHTPDEALNFATAAYRLADAMLKARELP